MFTGRLPSPVYRRRHRTFSQAPAGQPATDNLPCATRMINSGVFNSTNFRNGNQYFARIDKHFENDRIYGSFFRTTLNYGGAAVVPQFGTTNHNTQRALQLNWTHTFGPSTLTVVIVAQNRVEGFIGETGDFTIPEIGVSGLSPGYGVGFAQGNFIQNNYHWRDVLTHVRGRSRVEGGHRRLVRRRRGAVPGTVVGAILRLRQPVEAGQGCTYRRKWRDVQPGDRSAAALGLGRGLQDMGHLCPGHGGRPGTT